MDLADRFWAKVTKTPSCWLWTGAKVDGYGVIKVAGQTLYAHRVAHELLKGPIPEGKQIDHVCRNRACVRQDAEHCEAVTQQVNIARAVALRPKQTHCLRGHEYTEANTLRHRNGRACRACHNAKMRKRRRRERQRQS